MPRKPVRERESTGGFPLPNFEDYNNISVPLSPLRTEIVAYLKADINEIPLGSLLQLIAKVIKSELEPTDL